MTENEAKQWLKHTRAYQHKCDNCEYIDIKGACNEECKDFYDMAIQALEEIQAYRAIGTVKGFERAIESNIENYNLYREYKAKVQEYEAIGTIEDFKALKEKNTPKKPNKDEFDRFTCPDCGWIVSTEEYGGRFLPHCENCGQAIDWSE